MSEANSTTVALRGISSMATRHLLADLLRDYARETGVTVAMESVGGVDAAKRVAAGEPFDVVILARPALDKLAALGAVDAGTIVDIADSPIAVAVKAGALAPNLSDENAVRSAVLAASAIGYSTGPSGDHVVRMVSGFEREGARTPRLVQAPPGVPVATLVASGAVDLGFQQLGELMNTSGVEVAGLLPEALQAVTTFAGAATSCSGSGDEVKRLLGFLASPAVAGVKRRHGMSA